MSTEKDYKWDYIRMNLKDGFALCDDEPVRIIRRDGKPISRITSFWKPISECIQIGWLRYKSERLPKYMWKHDLRAESFIEVQ